MEAQRENEQEGTSRSDDLITDAPQGELKGKQRIRLNQKLRQLTFYSDLPWKGGRKVEEHQGDQESNVYEARESHKISR